MDSNDTFKGYKVKHLFLLVGENPLPNYVAAMKLLEKGCTAYLVYTNQTMPQRERLKIDLKNKGFIIEEVALDKQATDSNKSNAHRIYTKVKEYAAKVPSNERIGLHYTGGTNPMAIHSYRAIADLQRTDTVYSYLDAKTLEIFIDHPNSDSTHRGVQLEVPLEVLFRLHKYEWQQDQKPLPEPILPEAATEFVRLYQDEEIAKTWRTWSNTHRYNNSGELKKAIDSETGQWKSEDELSKLSLTLTGIHSEIIDVLRQKLDASQSQLSLKVTKYKLRYYDQTADKADKTRLTVPMQDGFVFREWLFLEGNLQICCGPTSRYLELQQLFAQINYFGKRGCFFQYLPDETQETINPQFEPTLQQSFVVQPMDDLGSKTTFNKINPYSTDKAQLDKDRIIQPGLLPLQLIASSAKYDIYHRN